MGEKHLFLHFSSFLIRPQQVQLKSKSEATSFPTAWVEM